jgi:hypothetical protein
MGTGRRGWLAVGAGGGAFGPGRCFGARKEHTKLLKGNTQTHTQHTPDINHNHKAHGAPTHPLGAPPPRSLKKYDIAGDGIATRDFVTVTGGAGATEFCKAQCAAMAECEFTVAQSAKCYLKKDLSAGTYGKTGASPITDATCVRGADNWLKFALQVSNLPAGGTAGLPGAPGLPGLPPGGPLPLPRRNVSGLGLANGAGGRAGAAAAAAAAALGACLWLLLGLLLA